MKRRHEPWIHVGEENLDNGNIVGEGSGAEKR